ncbi:MAG: hypothetical protein KDI30_02305 [Pseudomonadales bacterium]|nr:hypothetical protein [Pseudomonadales bacterium]
MKASIQLQFNGSFIRSFFKLAVTSVIILATPCPALASLSVSEGAQADSPLFGLGDFKKKDDNLSVYSESSMSPNQISRIVFDQSFAQNYRYPSGHMGNFVDPNYWQNDGDKMMSYWMNGDTAKSPADYASENSTSAETYFNFYMLDSSKIVPSFARNNETRPSLKLADRVLAAKENNATITFICNMVTPGADYFYATDDDPSTHYDTRHPRRTGWPGEVVSNAAYPSDPYGRTKDQNVWWDHMKQRAFACVHMLNKAKAYGLPDSQIRVELGNELFFQQRTYVLEAFPPALNSIVDSLDDSNDAFWQDYLPRTTGEDLPATEYEDDYSQSSTCPGGNNTTPLRTIIQNEYLLHGKYRFDEGCYDSSSDADIDYTNRTSAIQSIVERLPVDDSYAYAAKYFIDLIKHKVDAKEGTDNEIKFAAIKSDSKRGYLSDNGTGTADQYWDSNKSAPSTLTDVPLQTNNPNAWGLGLRRISEWDKVNLPVLLDAPDANNPQRLGVGDWVSGLVSHDYVQSPASCFDSSNWESFYDQNSEDPIGKLARVIYKDFEEKAYGDKGCVHQSCVTEGNRKPLWFTEYAFDIKSSSFLASRGFVRNPNLDPADDPGLIAANAYNHSWGKALATAYYISTLLGGSPADPHGGDHSAGSLDYFSIAAMLPWGDTENDPQAIGGTGKMLTLWNRAAKGADTLTPLSFGGVPTLAHSDPGPAGWSCTNDNSLGSNEVFLAGVHGWKFSRVNGFSNYIFINFTGDQQLLYNTNNELSSGIKKIITKMYVLNDRLSVAPSSNLWSYDNFMTTSGSIVLEPRSVVLVEFDTSVVNDIPDNWELTENSAILNDYLEQLFETRDSDRDGIPDSWESAAGSNPNVFNVDTDGDGLANSVEFDTVDLSAGETGKYEFDSDGDGMSDGWEVMIGSSPTVPNNYDDDGDGIPNYLEFSTVDLSAGETGKYEFDSDGDGLGDGQEIAIFGTNPTVFDTDNDGIPDGLDNHLTAGDSDGDRVKNAADSYDDISDCCTSGNYVLLNLSSEPSDPPLDSDNDGLIDLYESMVVGANLGSLDTDVDDLNDYDEVERRGTKVNTGDTDGDSLSDADELNAFTAFPLLTDTASDPLMVDSDSDGLNDSVELGFSSPTKPLNADSDGDGSPDDWEVNVFNSDPNLNNLDWDEDGVPNYIELNNYGTDRYKADSDDDGLEDGYEIVVYGTNPLSPHSDADINDFDGDGIPDGLEVLVGSDPLFINTDTDGDGIANYYEPNFGTDPYKSDTDCDGVNDGQELIDGTDPIGGACSP